MLDSILVYLNGTSAAPSVIDASVVLARRHEARIRALTIADTRAAESLLAGCESAVFAVVEHERLSQVELKQVAAHAELATACLAAGVNFDVRRESGDPFELLPREAGYHDLVITACETVCPSSRDEESEAVDPRTVIDLSLAGARPMLVVRGSAAPPSRALLIYDGTAAAGRAIRNFLRQDLWPDMEARLLAVGATDDEARSLQREMADACRRYSVVPESGHLRGPLRRVLAPYAEQWQADLIVLCAGRANSFVRRMFGDAALDVLQKTSCALYLGE